MTRCAAVLLLATSGCSFLAVRSTPQRDARTGIEGCGGAGFVVADLLGTAALGIGGVLYNDVAHSLNDRCGDQRL